MLRYTLVLRVFRRRMTVVDSVETPSFFCEGKTASYSSTNRCSGLIPCPVPTLSAPRWMMSAIFPGRSR